MTETFSAVFGFWGILTPAVFYAVIFLAGRFLGRPKPNESSSGRRMPGEAVSVVIAARDEAANLGPCLESVLAQESVRQIIVVDDHSTDGTAEVADEFTRRDTRVVRMCSPDLAPGWIGKSLALHTGARAANAPLILFCDADIILGPGVVDEAASVMTRYDLDHLSTHFYVLCRTVAERICSPVLVLSSSLALFGTARWIGAATGAFNMVRATSYWKQQGHEPLKRHVLDDVELARHLCRAGARSLFINLGNRVKVRLFVGLGGFLDLVSRSSVPFLRLGSVTACVAALMLMLLSLWTAACLFLPVAGLLTAHEGAGLARAVWWFGPLPYVAGLSAVAAAGQFTDAAKGYRLLYPAAAMLLGFGVFRAGLHRLCGKPVSWRGRNYQVT